MDIVITVVHVLVCIFLVIAVLMQSGKGGGLAGALGGGMSSSSVMGGRSASAFLTKTTAVLAGVFMLLCLVQSFTYTAPQVDDSTATERMLEQGGGAPPLSPAFTEGLLEEASDDAAASQQTPAGEDGRVEELPAVESVQSE